MFLSKEPPKLLQANLIVAFNPPKDQQQNFNSFLNKLSQVDLDDLKEFDNMKNSHYFPH